MPIRSGATATTFHEMVVDWYKSHGYDFLGLSDHDVRAHKGAWRALPKLSPKVLEAYRKRFGDAWVQTRKKNDKLEVYLKALDEFRGQFEVPGKFLLIENEEITSGYDRYNVHMNAINIADTLRPERGSSVLDTLQLNLAAVKKQADRAKRPILVQVNHPNWSNYDISPEDLAQATDARFFEVCNCCPGTRFAGDADHPGTERLWGHRQHDSHRPAQGAAHLWNGHRRRASLSGVWTATTESGPGVDRGPRGNAFRQSPRRWHESRRTSMLQPGSSSATLRWTPRQVLSRSKSTRSRAFNIRSTSLVRWLERARRGSWSPSAAPANHWPPSGNTRPRSARCLPRFAAPRRRTI